MINQTIAIIGASNNKEKYGNIVFNKLRKNNTVIPINVHESYVEHIKAYKSLTNAKNGSKVRIDLVVFVVPPSITNQVLKEVKELGLKKVWLQPGSEDKEAIEFCEKNKIECIHSQCILLI
jgi:uncharacterized protein